MASNKKQLVYWRRVGLDHVYAIYKDNDHQPEDNPLVHPDYKGWEKHGHRHLSEIIPVHIFEVRHMIKVNDNDEPF